MKKLFRNLRVKAVIGFWSLNLKANNIQRLLFYLLILFLPTQFGRHFWPEFSFVRGARIDYLSPTLYATDILTLLIFVFWIFSSGILNIKNKISNIIFDYWKLVVLVVFLIFGIFLSKNQGAGAYGLVKLLEFGFLGFYVAHNIHKLKLENILLMFSIGIIFESFLSVAQYFNHGSINGIFYFFGERFFNSQTLGIANASLNGELILRPYGTFPHTNVLAGYLLIGMSLIILSRIKNYESRIKGIIFILTLTIGTLALLLTLSRVAILLWLIVIGSWLIVKIKNKKSNLKKMIGLLVVLVCIGSIVSATPLGIRFTDIKLTDESIVQRESLIQSSITMIKDNPLFGVGLNNFLVNLPSKEIIQPVHNIFFLIAAETGLAGLIFSVWFIFKTFSRIKNHESRIKGWTMIHNSLFIILSSVLILGLFDHYFLTLQQGQLLFAFVLGLCWAKGFHNSLPQFYPKRFFHKINKTRTFSEN